MRCHFEKSGNCHTGGALDHQSTMGAYVGRITLEDGKGTMPEEERVALEEQIQTDYDLYQMELKQRQRKIDNQEGAVLREVMKVPDPDVPEVRA